MKFTQIYRAALAFCIASTNFSAEAFAFDYLMSAESSTMFTTNSAIQEGLGEDLEAMLTSAPGAIVSPQTPVYSDEVLGSAISFLDEKKQVVLRLSKLERLESGKKDYVLSLGFGPSLLSFFSNEHLTLRPTAKGLQRILFDAIARSNHSSLGINKVKRPDASIYQVHVHDAYGAIDCSENREHRVECRFSFKKP